MNNSDNRLLLNEELHIGYRLRSTFFYRKLHELGFAYLDKEVEKLEAISRNFNWERRSEWGIANAAWNEMEERQIDPVAVFAHPRVLQEQPKLSAYYRNVAALPQKAVKKLALNKVDKVEAGKTGILKSQEAFNLCRLYNTHSSLIIENATSFGRGDALRMMLLSAGAQINGSWLNQIGIEAELVAQGILVRAALNARIINSVIVGNEETLSDISDSILEYVGTLTGIRFENQTTILFSSEPDMAILDSNGKRIAVVEIKGGKDTAGALERYGAAKKSFDKARQQDPHVITIYLASCITEEVHSRLEKDVSVNRHFNLTEILVDEGAKSEFLTFLFQTLNYGR